MRHLGPIAGIASHGRMIATAGYDNRIVLWDGPARAALARGCHDHLVNHCQFSADGRWLVSASSDYSARLWDVPSMRLQTVLTGHTDDVDMAAFSPDDRRIATVALDRCVRVFDLSGRCLQEMHGHTGNVLSVAWTRDGTHIVSTSVDGTIREWHAESGKAVRTTDLAVRTDSVAIGPDGTLYAGDDRGRIAIIEAGRTRFVECHRAGVKKVVLDARQSLLVSLSYDRMMIAWGIDARHELVEVGRTSLPETIWARAACILDDGRIAAGTFGSTYAIFDPRSATWDLDGVAAGPAINAALDVGGRIYTVGDAGLVKVDSADRADMGSLCNFLVAAGGRAFTGGQAGRIFDADNGAVLFEHHSPLNCGTAFQRGGRPHIAIGTYTGEILVFALSDDGGLLPVATLQVYENAVKGLAGADGLLFSVCANSAVAWHRIDDWSLVERIHRAHERIANACCAIGNGQFASVSRDRTLRLWGTGRSEVYASPHPNSVKCIAANGDRTALLTGSYGGTVAKFDLVARRWSPVQRPTAAGISAIAWDAAHGRFLAASYDGTLYPVAE